MVWLITIACRNGRSNLKRETQLDFCVFNKATNTMDFQKGLKRGVNDHEMGKFCYGPVKKHVNRLITDRFLSKCKVKSAGKRRSYLAISQCDKVQRQTIGQLRVSLYLYEHEIDCIGFRYVHIAKPIVTFVK